MHWSSQHGGKEEQRNNKEDTYVCRYIHPYLMRTVLLNMGVKRNKERNYTKETPLYVGIFILDVDCSSQHIHLVYMFSKINQCFHFCSFLISFLKASLLMLANPVLFLCMYVCMYVCMCAMYA